MRVVLQKTAKPLHPMLLFSSLWIHIDIDSLWPHIMGLYLLMVSYLAQSLCKCRCAPNIAAVLLKNPRIFRPCSRSVNPAAFTWTRCCDWSQISLRVQSNHLAFSLRFFSHCSWHSATLQEMTENCDCNNANGPTPDHSCLFDRTKTFLWVNNHRHWKRSTI